MRSEAAAFSIGEAQIEPARRPAARPVDLVHLSRYTLGDREIEREVLALFASQAVVYLDRLAKAATATEWREAAHSLKGSARAVGAWRTAEAAERAEAAGGALATSRSTGLAEIEFALREAEDYIRTLFKDC
jgi:HPt (histidine-containing phosphotransfer) domain-containing protein